MVTKVDLREELSRQLARDFMEWLAECWPQTAGKLPTDRLVGRLEMLADKAVGEAIEAFGNGKSSELIAVLPTETLVAIVMRLTGGSVNPDLPKAQAERIKKTPTE